LSLTLLETKLAEVLGLATATRGATAIVVELVRDSDEDLAEQLARMGETMAETEERCRELASGHDEHALLAHAGTVKGKADRALLAWIDTDARALDGLEFLTGAIAAEVARWSSLAQYNVRAQDEDLTELIAWALPVQQRHLQTVLEAVREIASEDDPDARA
jgi:hypothetical protein